MKKTATQAETASCLSFALISASREPIALNMVRDIVAVVADFAAHGVRPGKMRHRVGFGLAIVPQGSPIRTDGLPKAPKENPGV